MSDIPIQNSPAIKHVKYTCMCLTPQYIAICSNLIITYKYWCKIFCFASEFQRIDWIRVNCNFQVVYMSFLWPYYKLSKCKWIYINNSVRYLSKNNYLKNQKVKIHVTYVLITFMKYPFGSCVFHGEDGVACKNERR